jgi:hypothetical protein
MAYATISSSVLAMLPWCVEIGPPDTGMVGRSTEFVIVVIVVTIETFHLALQQVI